MIGSSPSRPTAMARGLPVAGNGSIGGRQMNRRVGWCCRMRTATSRPAEQNPAAPLGCRRDVPTAQQGRADGRAGRARFTGGTCASRQGQKIGEVFRGWLGMPANPGIPVAWRAEVAPQPQPIAVHRYRRTAPKRPRRTSTAARHPVGRSCRNRGHSRSSQSSVASRRGFWGRRSGDRGRQTAAFVFPLQRRPRRQACRALQALGHLDCKGRG